MIQINTQDFKIIKQNIIDIRLKIKIYDERNGDYIGELECGVINGTENINAESDIRRTCSITAIPLKNKYLIVDKDGILWMNRIFKMEIAILDRVQNLWYWYKQGDYILSNTSVSYDGTTNQRSEEHTSELQSPS